MSSRSYWTGLPVGVTVHDDGTVVYEIDTSEASEGMSDAWNESDELSESIDETQLMLDCAVVDGDRAEHGQKPEARLSAIHLVSMKCPRQYSCEFRTRDLEEMATHITDAPHGPGRF